MSNSNGNTAQDPIKIEYEDLVVEPDYVVVQDAQEGAEPIELPTNPEDKTLALVTLEHTFPGAHGLKFKNPATGASRALMLDPSGKSFIPPAGGWQDKVFTVIFRPTTTPVTKKMPSDNVSGEASASTGLEEEDEEGLSDASEQKVKEANKNGGTGSQGGGGEEAAVNLKGEQTVVKSKAAEGSTNRLNKRKVNGNEETSDLIILGLPYKLTTSEMKAYFEQFGAVTLCQIKTTPTGVSRGFGFVHMADYENQIKVLSNLNHVIGERKCQVRLPVPRDGREQGESFRNPKVFVGRLQEKTTNEELKEFFEGHAHRIDSKSAVLDVFIPKPFRGFAFVTFSSPLVAKELIRQGDFIIDDQTVSVTAAAPKGVDPKALPPTSSSSSSRPGFRGATKFGSVSGGPISARAGNFGSYDDRYDMGGFSNQQGRGNRYSPYSPQYGRQGSPSRQQQHQSNSRYYDQFQQQQLPGQTMMEGGGRARPDGFPDELTPALSRMNPEVANAAMKAFWMVAQSGTAVVNQSSNMGAIASRNPNGESSMHSEWKVTGGNEGTRGPTNQWQ